MLVLLAVIVERLRKNGQDNNGNENDDNDNGCDNLIEDFVRKSMEKKLKASQIKFLTNCMQSL